MLEVHTATVPVAVASARLVPWYTCSSTIKSPEPPAAVNIKSIAYAFSLSTLSTSVPVAISSSPYWNNSQVNSKT